MAKAVLNGTVLADSDNTVMIEGNHYFPPSSVNWELFAENTRSTVCPWKGAASYYDVSVGGETTPSLAWTYHDPKAAAAEIKDYVAFYGQVTVSS